VWVEHGLYLVTEIGSRIAAVKHDPRSTHVPSSTFVGDCTARQCLVRPGNIHEQCPVHPVLIVCLLLNGTSVIFKPLVPRIVEVEHMRHVDGDL